jgi:hypothetical protein
MAMMLTIVVGPVLFFLALCVLDYLIEEYVNGR